MTADSELIRSNGKNDTWTIQLYVEIHVCEAWSHLHDLYIIITLLERFFTLALPRSLVDLQGNQNTSVKEVLCFSSVYLNWLFVDLLHFFILSSFQDFLAFCISLLMRPVSVTEIQTCLEIPQVSLVAAYEFSEKRQRTVKDLLHFSPYLFIVYATHPWKACVWAY